MNPLQRILSDAQAEEMVSFLASKPLYNAHVTAKSDGVARSLADARGFAFGSHLMSDVVQAPHVLKTAYEHCPQGKVCYSINAWWSFAGHEAKSTRHWHVDNEGAGALALFLNLVDPRQAHHQYQQEVAGKMHTVDVLGNVGFGWWLHVSQEHRSLPVKNDRFLMWIRYHADRTGGPSYVTDRLAPIKLSIPNEWKEVLSLVVSSKG